MHKNKLTFFVVLVILIALPFFLPTNRYLELLSHFSAIFLSISLVFCLIFACCKNKSFLWFSLLVTALSLYPVIRSLDGNGIPRKEPIGKDISVYQCNIYYKNKTAACLLSSISELQYPDILVLQEVTPELMSGTLKHLKAQYPYSFEAPEAGAYGMAILSKIPIVKAQRKNFAQSPNKYTIIEFITSEEKIPFTLIEVHAFSPLRDLKTDYRKQELEELPTIAALAPPGNKILVGDLNTTPYSPYFQELKTRLDFKNAMGGITMWPRTMRVEGSFNKIYEWWQQWDPFGRLQLQGTWPTYLPFFLRIPIDHLLTSKTMRVLKRTVCEPVGSDHLPVVTYIRLWGRGEFNFRDVGI